MQELGVVAAIAVNAHEAGVKQIIEEVSPDFQVHVLPVPCWGAIVPALNTLLNFAQRCGMQYILYQSLEVQCTPAILRRLVDHHTSDTLVVGPALEGHNFRPGEQVLNGRTAPWNALALWQVRKLALTGFLCIADGLPDAPPSVGREGLASLQSSNGQEPDSPHGVMGSTNWWTHEMSSQSASGSRSSVPAGVAEVTAIALLQHLHGHDRARVVLLQLGTELQAQLSWTNSSGKDERRKTSHKMESKVSRPAAQLEELFKFRKSKSAPQLRKLGTPVGYIGSRLACLKRGGEKSQPDLAAAAAAEEPSQELAAEEETRKEGEAQVAAAAGTGSEADGASDDGALNCGTVTHYGESIPPPMQVKLICLVASGLFSANSTAVLATAFRHINASPVNASSSSMMFVGLLIGGVYLPIPLSLWLTRTVTRRANHIAGLVIFAGFLLLGHVSIILSQVLGWGPGVLLAARLVQGLGSGVLFQVRFVLAQVSTSDHHVELQSWSFLVSDLGLGVGALLPGLTSLLVGNTELTVRAPELLTTAVLALISLAYLAWVVLVFPRRLPFLSARVRFPSKGASHRGSRLQADSKEVDKYRVIVWISGTLRVFVQSAIIPVVALSMRDANWTGNFRQTIAVAAICLLPMPFEAIVSRICCTCSLRSRFSSTADASKLASGAVGAFALVVASATPRSVIGEDGEIMAMLMRICELAVLMIALAMAAPFNASRLYQLKDAERTLVLLEWMKAYFGRLLGPLCAVLVYSWVGYGAVLAALCCATAVVTFTA